MPKNDENLSSINEVQNINSDLMNAKKVICINSLKEPKKSIFAKQLIDNFKKLSANYPTITSEEKLLLISFSINLALYFYEKKETSQLIRYLEKMQSYYRTICTDNFLGDAQKGKWSAVMGEVYKIKQDYNVAIGYYEKALIFEKNNKSDRHLKTLQHYNLMIVELNLRQAEKEKLEPTLAYNAYKKAVDKANEALKFPPSNLNLRIYYFKSEALARLALIMNKQKQPWKAIQLFFKAILSDFLCMKCAPDDFAKHLEHMKICNQKILSALNNMDVEKKIKSKFEGLNSLICAFDIINLNTLDQTLRELQGLFTSLSNRIKTEFWQQSKKSVEKDMNQSSNAVIDWKNPII